MINALRPYGYFGTEIRPYLELTPVTILFYNENNGNSVIRHNVFDSLLLLHRLLKLDYREQLTGGSTNFEFYLNDPHVLRYVNKVRNSDVVKKVQQGVQVNTVTLIPNVVLGVTFKGTLCKWSFNVVSSLYSDDGVIITTNRVLDCPLVTTDQYLSAFLHGVEDDKRNPDKTQMDYMTNTKHGWLLCDRLRNLHHIQDVQSLHTVVNDIELPEDVANLLVVEHNNEVFSNTDTDLLYNVILAQFENYGQVLLETNDPVLCDRLYNTLPRGSCNDFLTSGLEGKI